MNIYSLSQSSEILNWISLGFKSLISQIEIAVNNKQLLVVLCSFYPYEMPAVEQNISSRAGELLLTKHPTVQFFILCTWHYLYETVISSYTCQWWSCGLWWRWWLISVHSQYTSSLRAPFSIHLAGNSELMNEGAIADTAFVSTADICTESSFQTLLSRASFMN